MKTLKQLFEKINLITELTSDSIKAVEKFGSKNTLIKKARNPGIGKMSSPGLAGSRNRPTQ
jgi:hypothetical protein